MNYLVAEGVQHSHAERIIVMLSAAKHLVAQRDRLFAECTLSGTNVLRVTGMLVLMLSID